jgi:hypothetical protein
LRRWETPAGVLEYEHGPRLLRFKLNSRTYAEREKPKPPPRGAMLQAERSIRN